MKKDIITYAIRFTNSEGTVVRTTITNKSELKKITKIDAKCATIDCRISDDMPVALHNAVAEHNSKVEKQKAHESK